MKAVVDDGAMCGAIDSAVFQKVAARLSALAPSGRVLRMANGVKVPSQGVWKGMVDVGGIKKQGQFEVFPSGGAWSMLFGKPLLEEFEMQHDYKTDELILPVAGGTDQRLPNQHGYDDKTKAIFLLHSETRADIPEPSDPVDADKSTPDTDVARMCRTLINAISRAAPFGKAPFEGIFSTLKSLLP